VKDAGERKARRVQRPGRKLATEEAMRAPLWEKIAFGYGETRIRLPTKLPQKLEEDADAFAAAE